MDSQNSSLCNPLDPVSGISTQGGQEVGRTDEKFGGINKQGLDAAFRHRTNQLYSPIYTIPPEILSLIFQRMVKPDGLLKPGFCARSRDLQRAFALAHVSTYFRAVALGTSELWKRVFLSIPADEPTKWVKCSSLLHHCASYTPHLELSVKAQFYHECLTAEMIAEIFSSPAVNRKIKALELLSLFNTYEGMLSFLSSLPALHTFVLFNQREDHEFYIDLSSLSLSHVAIYDTTSLEWISLPSTMQVLHFFDMSYTLNLDFLKECPNLVELVIDNLDYCNKLHNPVTLNHLKRLSATTIHKGAAPFTNLQAPILDFLSLGWSYGNDEGGPASILPFCRQVSTTLTTLILEDFPETWNSTDFQLLFGVLPKLRILELNHRPVECIIQPIYALHHQKDSCETICLPSLERLVVASRDSNRDHPPSFSNWFLHLLANRNVGETSYFHLDFRVEFSAPWDQIWLPQLRDKLRWISRGRRIEITHYNKRIEWLNVE